MSDTPIIEDVKRSMSIWQEYKDAEAIGFQVALMFAACFDMSAESQWGSVPEDWI